MSTPNFCNLCNRNVVPTKDFNWLLFIFLCGCFYLPFYMMAKKKCPICAGENFGPAKAEEVAKANVARVESAIAEPANGEIAKVDAPPKDQPPV